MSFMYFLTDTLRLIDVSSAIDLDLQLQYYYPNYTKEDLYKLYNIYTDLIDIINKEIIFDRSNIVEGKMLFPELASKSSSKIQSNFYSKVVGYDMNSAVYSVLNFYKRFPKSVLNEFHYYTWLINDRLSELDAIYRKLIRKTLYIHLVTVLTIKHNIYYDVRQFVYDVMMDVLFYLRINNIELLNYTFDGLYFPFSGKEIKFSVEKNFNFKKDFLKNFIKFNKNMFVFLNEDKLIIKGMPYKDPPIYRKFLKLILEIKLPYNKIYDKDYILENSTIYDFIIRQAKKSNNDQVITLHGERVFSDTNIDDINYKAYLNMFESKYGKVLKGLSQWIT